MITRERRKLLTITAETGDFSRKFPFFVSGLAGLMLRRVEKVIVGG